MQIEISKLWHVNNEYFKKLTINLINLIVTKSIKVLQYS